MKLKHLLQLLGVGAAGYLYYWIKVNVNELAAVAVFSFIAGMLTVVVIYSLAHQSLIGAVANFKNLMAPAVKEQIRVDGEYLRQQARTQGQYDRTSMRYSGPAPQPQPPSEADAFFAQHQQYRV
jgi:hypothetical protein